MIPPRRRAPLAAVLSGVFGLAAGPLASQTKTDPEVAKGIRQVDDGDFDSAILTLDAAARRLASDPANAGDLAQAYVYLGVAYLGKGAETSAKAQFREALARVRDLKLSPEKFAPRVIELFEKAREEVRAERVPPAPGPTTSKKGGGSKGLLIAGGVVAAGAGAALAVSGGGGSETANTRSEVRSGILTTTNGYFASYQFGPAQAGAWRAEVSWGDAQAVVLMSIFKVGCATCTGPIAVGNLQTGGRTLAEFAGEAGTQYEIVVYANPKPTDGRQVTYELRVTLPPP
jgi:hypothetical protein